MPSAGEAKNGYVLPPKLEGGDDEAFDKPENILNLTELYHRHRKLKIQHDQGESLAEFNLLVRVNSIRDMEDDVEINAYLTDGKGKPLSESYQLSMKKADNKKDFSKDTAAWFVITNIFYEDIVNDGLHLVVNTVTVRPSLKSGGKMVAGHKFRQPYGVGCLSMPSKELMKLVKSWESGRDGYEVEVNLDFLMGSEGKFCELPEMLINNAGDMSKVNNVKGELSLTLSMWYGVPCAPTLPKDATFKKSDSLLQHFVASSGSIAKRKRLGDPSNHVGAALKSPTKGRMIFSIPFFERKMGPRILQISVDGNKAGNTLDSPRNSRSSPRTSLRVSNADIARGKSSWSLRSGKMPKSQKANQYGTMPRLYASGSKLVMNPVKEAFALDKSDLREYTSKGPELNFEFVTVIPRRPLHKVLPMGEFVNGVFLTLGQVNTEKLNTKSMKKAPKNVLTKVTLRENKSRHSYSGAIAPALGKTITCQPEYNCLVYYHQNSPTLNERFLIMLPEEPELNHVHIEFFHCSSSKPPEPLGFSFLRLGDENMTGFVKDGTHVLPILKYSRKSGESDQNTDYLRPDQSKKDLQRGTISVTTELSSNIASQDIKIHWFLNYSKAEDPVKAVNDILEVKLNRLESHVPRILGTLFNIFASTDKPNLQEPALHVLMSIFGLTSNPFHQLPELVPYVPNESAQKKSAERKKNAIILTERKLRSQSVFKANPSITEAYIPLYQQVDHWIGTRMKEATGGKVVIAIKSITVQWRKLFEWTQTEEAKDTSHSNWRIVLLALRSCNMLTKILLKLIPFGTSDKECKKSPVLKAIYNVRVQIRGEIVQIGKLTSALLVRKELPFKGYVQRYIIDRGAMWLGSMLECFEENIAVKIMCDFVKPIVKLPNKEDCSDRGIPLSMHYLQFAHNLEREGLFTSPGFCQEMLVPILDTLSDYLHSPQVGVKLQSITVLNALLPVLTTGIMDDDGSREQKIKISKLTRERARSRHTSKFPVERRVSISKLHRISPIATAVAVKGGYPSTRKIAPYHPRFRGVIDITEENLVKLAAKLFPSILRVFREIRDKEQSHSYLYFFDNNRLKLKEAEVQSGLALIMMANIMRLHMKISPRFSNLLKNIEKPVTFLRELMQAASSLVQKSLFEHLWLQLRLCEIKFIQGVMQQSSAWAVVEITKHRPQQTTVGDTIDASEMSLGEGLDAFCKQYWRLAVNLLMCGDLQLERLPQKRAAYIHSHMKDLREAIIHDMRGMQQTMGKGWARYHRTLFPPLLKTSIMLSERSGHIVRKMLFDLVMHLWRLHRTFKPALHITVDVATDLVMKLSQIRQTSKLQRLNKAHELRKPRWCRLGLSKEDVPWMSLAALVKMHPLILSIQELFTGKLKSNLKEYMAGEAKALPDTIAALKVEKEGAIKRFDYSQAQKIHDEILRLEQQARDQTSGDREFIEQFNSYCQDIAKYFQFLVIAIRIPRTPEFEDDGIDVCVWLIQFLKKIGKKEQCSQVYDMFVQMHLKFQNGTEQGNALLEYADFLSWETKDIKKKFKLLGQAHKVFHEANSLAQCVQVCKRLALAHEMYSLKFMDVARTLRDQAGYFETLSKKDQISARYYRVFFVGRGLPAHLRGNSYVYRSGSATRLISVGEFTNQIKGFFPGAKVVNTTEPPTLKLVSAALQENLKWREKEIVKELKTVEQELSASDKSQENLLRIKQRELKQAILGIETGEAAAVLEPKGSFDTKDGEAREVKRIVTESPHLKLIQITTLTVSNDKEMEGKDHHLVHVDATKRHKRYHHENDISVFMYTRVIKPSSSSVRHYCEKHKCQVPPSGNKRNEYRELWVQRNYVLVQQPMPAVRRRVPISTLKTSIFTPLRNAIVTLRNKNEEMKSAVLQAKGSDEPNDLVPLTQNLSGVIDAAVAGGIANYIDAFFDGSYIRSMPQEESRIAQFKETLEAQLEILNKGLQVFHSKLENNSKLMPLFQHLQGSYSKMVVQLAKGILKRDISLKIKTEMY